MRALVISSMCTSASFIITRFFMKKIVTPIFYVTMFVALFLFIFIGTQINANEPEFLNDYIIEKSEYCSDINYRDHLLNYTVYERYCIKEVLITKTLTDAQRKKYKKKRDFELKEAKRNEANLIDRSWWIPCTDDRAFTRAALKTSAIATVAVYNKAAAVGMFLDILQDYVFSCVDDWYYIRDQSNWCKAHYEMYEWYCHVLENG